ncbi:hypothetical protein I4U23_001497 [Adineta vaga]|nr:hypothetical protein I4U23_001497 [Adineta vaga]
MTTCFEDLSNELFYEIFDYFDICYTYETFAQLNNRFYQLIHYSTIPLAFNFSLLSKKTFQHRCNSIVQPNIHRIQSLCLSHHLLIDEFFKRISFNSTFIRFETLILYNVKSDNLVDILTNLISLPRLSSLTITTIDEIRSRDFIYFLIIPLSSLKYCKLSIETWNQDYIISLTNIQYSSLEYLIIESTCNLNELLEILAFTPQLKYLSCKISLSNNTLSEISIIPMNLVQLHFQLEMTSFDEFEWFICSFRHQFQVLSVSTKSDLEYLYADRWEQLIRSQMPCLQRFYLQYQSIINEEFEEFEIYCTLVEGFNSSFWLEKGWLFKYQLYTCNDGSSWIKFHSIKPYRWQQYDIYENTIQATPTSLNLASDIHFHSYEPITEDGTQFSRVTRLTLSDGDQTQIFSFIFQLPQLFPALQLTELIITDNNFRFEHLLSFSNHFPNLQSLTIPKTILYLSSPQSQTNQLTMNRNTILEVTILNQCILDDIQILLRFCPTIQSLDIEVDLENLQIILYYLLWKYTNRTHKDRQSPSIHLKNHHFWKHEYTNCLSCSKMQSINSSENALPCNHHLSSLCCRNINYRMIEKFRKMIDQEALLDDYSIEYLDQRMYLWW